MTVLELINLLCTMPPNLPVVQNSGDCDEPCEISEVRMNWTDAESLMWVDEGKTNAKPVVELS